VLSLSWQGRLFAPQNRVGKASDFAPQDLFLSELVEAASKKYAQKTA
jgi:hypothetical protein